jgi:hypothetical protein
MILKLKAFVLSICALALVLFPGVSKAQSTITAYCGAPYVNQHGSTDTIGVSSLYAGAGWSGLYNRESVYFTFDIQWSATYSDDLGNAYYTGWIDLGQESMDLPTQIINLDDETGNYFNNASTTINVGSLVSSNFHGDFTWNSVGYQYQVNLTADATRVYYMGSFVGAVSNTSPWYNSPTQFIYQ